MPAILMEAPAPPSISEPSRKKWTREELAIMLDVGVDLRRFELIDGDLIDKMSQNRPHVNRLHLIGQRLIQVFGYPQVQLMSPVDVAPPDEQTLLEPDAAVLRFPVTRFKKTHPGPADLLLVVEISNSTLGFDLNRKAELYAQAGVPDYWVLNVNGRRLFVHREPVDGKYRSILVYAENESVAPLAAPESPFPVAAAFVED